MTTPRYNVPASTWLVTRRCSERRFFLRPDAFVGRAILFILGYALTYWGLELHAVVALSNHWHLVVSDVRGKKSQFFQFVHGMIGRSINAFRGRFEGFWASGKTNMVRLVTPDDALDKIVYVITNPVRAGLVEKVADWPGLVTLPEHYIEGELRTERPNRFFDKRGPLGEATIVRLSKPPGFEHMGPEEFAAEVGRRVEDEERRLADERGDKPVLGAAKVLSTSWSSKPKSSAPRFGRHPHIACRDRELRVKAIQELERFWDDYHQAAKRFAGGARNTLFPFGTLLLRTRFRVRCRGPGRSRGAAACGVRVPRRGAATTSAPPSVAGDSRGSATPPALDDYSDF